MYDAGRMCGRHTVGQLRCQFHHLSHRHGALLHLRPQLISFDQFTDHVLQALGVAHFIERHNVGMAEGGDGAGLALEASTAVGVARERLGRILRATSRPRRASLAR